MPTYYLDFANQIISYLGLDNEVNENVNKLIKKLPFHVKIYGVRVIIPQISFGETLSELYFKFKNIKGKEFTFYGLETKISEILNLINKMQADLKPPTWEAISVYNTLRSEDSFLADKVGPVDLLILSQAISDPSADHLFTTDMTLIDSQTTNVVKNQIKKYKEEGGFTITDYI